MTKKNVCDGHRKNYIQGSGQRQGNPAGPEWKQTAPLYMSQVLGEGKETAV